LERVGSPPPDAGVWTKAQFLAHVRSKPVAPMPREVGAAAPPATFPFPTFADGPGPPVGRFAPVNKGGSPQLQWVPDARGEPTQLRWSVVGTEGRKELVVRDGAAAYTLGWPFDTAPTPVALGGGRLLVRARTTWGLHALDQPGPMRRLAGSSNPVEAVSDGRYLLESDAPPFYVQWATLRDARTGAVLWRLEQPPGTRMGLSGGFDLLPDRFVAVLGNANGLAGGLSAVQMVDKATGTPLWSAAITAESVTGGAQLTPDGKFLILPCRTGQDAMLFAFAAADGRRAAEIRWPAGTRLRNWTLSPDGRTIAVVHGREVRLHRTETGETLHRLTGYADAVSQALFSPDGGRLFCTTGEAPIGGGPTAPTRVRLHVWDPHTGRELLALPVSGRLTAVDGGRLVGLTGPDGRPVDGTPAVKP
jgi:hypothetical protein